MLFRFAIAVGRALDGYRLLVAERDARVATAIRDAVATQGGEVLGPVPSVGEAFGILTSEPVDCAIVDAGLCGDPCPLLDLLVEEAVPIVLTVRDGGTVPGSYRRLPMFDVSTGVATIADALSRAIERTASVPV